MTPPPRIGEVLISNAIITPGSATATDVGGRPRLDYDSHAIALDRNELAAWLGRGRTRAST
jgi:hypothetical protein